MAHATSPRAVKNVAGLYDWYQDGLEQDPASIQAGESIKTYIPNAKIWVRENRAMVNRAVRLLARAGVTQVVDLGSGKPAPHGKSTHEAVRGVAGEARVLYVEIEESAVVEGRRVVEACGEGVGVICESALNPAAIMGSEEAGRVIDWGEPVVLVMSALVHFFRPEEYRGMMAFWRARLRSGSAVVVTHGSFDGCDRGALMGVLAQYERMGMEAFLRSREQVMDVMEGWELMEPGVVRAGDWCPEAREEGEDAPVNFEFWWVGVGRLWLRSGR